MLQFELIRAGKRAADVFVLPSGRTIVEWPTSVIVYDDFAACYAVHVEHMGGRGEETSIDRWPVSRPDTYWRGAEDCYQDRCEGIPLRRVLEDKVAAPDYVEGDDAKRAYEVGYEVQGVLTHGLAWKSFPDLAEAEGP